VSPKGIPRKRAGYATIGLLACLCGAVLALLSVRCASLDTLAGTGSQAGNGRIACSVYNSDGTPASGAAVVMRRRDYTADTSGTALRKRAVSRGDTYTDAHGAFGIDSVDTGSYFIEVNDGLSHAVLLTCAVALKDTLVRIPDDTLYPTGSIIGVLASLPDTPVVLYVQIYGLERVGVRAASSGSFVVNDLPRGRHAVRVLASSAPYRPVEFDNVAVVSGQATDLGNIDFVHLSQWLYSKRLYLNTAAAGAGVSGTVVNFPVLIRLRAGNFDFSQAKTDGGDVRFTKADGTPLPYEIERYDAGSREAEIWVKADTVYGNDSSHYFIMYWGNQGAASGSNGAAVFDTANGFQGIWHLAEAGNAIAKDATGNHYDGTPSDTAPAGAEGAVGGCRAFNGSSNYIRMNGTAAGKLNFQENGIYTISAWVYADSLDNAPHLIAGKGNDQYFLKFKTSYSPNPMVWEFVEYHDKAGWYITNSLPVIPSVKTWTCLVGVRKGTAQYFYLNGELVDSSISVSPSSASRQTRDDFTIGKFSSVPADSMEGMCPFLGYIDEVRVMSNAPNADWIRLCYMNQKEQDALVKW
jgi:hypothetical protein